MLCAILSEDHINAAPRCCISGRRLFLSVSTVAHSQNSINHSQWSQAKERSWLMFVSSFSLAFFNYIHCGFWSVKFTLTLEFYKFGGWRISNDLHISQQFLYFPRWEVTASDLWLGRFRGRNHGNKATDGAYQLLQPSDFNHIVPQELFVSQLSQMEW